MVTDGEIVLIVIVCFLGGLAQGWYFGQGRTKAELKGRIEWQGRQILRDAEIIEGLKDEMQKLLYCRFHGGTPKPKPSRFGTLVIQPTLGAKVWSADFVRRRALAIMGLK